MTYTRRDIAKLALSSAALTVLPVMGQGDEAWTHRLEVRLNAMLEEGAFKVTTLTRSGDKATATLTLTWPPGERRRRIEATGGYDALEAAAIETFTDALTVPVA